MRWISVLSWLWCFLRIWNMFHQCFCIVLMVKIKFRLFHSLFHVLVSWRSHVRFSFSHSIFNVGVCKYSNGMSFFFHTRTPIVHEIRFWLETKAWHNFLPLKINCNYRFEWRKYSIYLLFYNSREYSFCLIHIIIHVP